MSIKYILQVLGFAYFLNQQKIDKMFPTAVFSDYNKLLSARKLINDDYLQKQYFS